MLLTNHLQSVVRHARRNPGFSLVNVFGLAVAFMAVIGIAMFVRGERAMDDFHDQADRLYRLNKVVTPPEGGEERHAITSGLMGPTLAREQADVEAAVRVLPWFSPLMTGPEENKRLLSDILLVDANFFEVFDFDLVRGDPSLVLAQPATAVVTEALATELFGTADPIGRTVQSVGDVEYTITGVAADPPGNSHLTFSILLSWETTVPGVGPLNWAWLNNWLTQVHYTYVLLSDQAAAERMADVFPAFMETHFPERAREYQLYLQPLSEIYLGSSDLQFVTGIRTGNGLLVRVLMVVGMLILLLACLNFTNMSLARAFQRLPEVGVRRALGAGAAQLAAQFLWESVAYVVGSLLLAAVVVQALLPLLAENAAYSLGWHCDVLGLIVLLAVAAVAIAGVYPAVMLARRGGARHHRSSHRIRRVLVVGQFAATIALLIVTSVVFRQTRFVQTRSPGFDTDQLMVVRMADSAVAAQAEAFKTSVLALPGVTGASITSNVPGQTTMSFTVVPEGVSGDSDRTSNVMRVGDDAFYATYGLTLVDGRFPDASRPSDISDAVVINERAAAAWGWADPVGMTLTVSGEIQDATVIGVVEDFHYESLHHAVSPLVMYHSPRANYLTVRFMADRAADIREGVEATWKQFDAAVPVSAWFMDAAWAELYAQEQRLTTVLLLFVGLTLVVACLGLLGLAILVTTQRQKEIGIRKALGASSTRIVRLVSGEFVALVLAGAVLALPVAWMVTDRWLSGFSYRVDAGGVSLLLPVVGAVVLAGLSVGVQALRSARMNPVDSLRSE
ncbi:MAG: ABC transporter permease [Rhodothermales bacterium]